MEFVDNIPEKSNGPRRRLIGDAEIAELRANLGLWAVVRTYCDRGTAPSVASSIRRYAPPDIEAEYRGFTLYVRSVGRS